MVGEPADEHGVPRLCATQEFFTILRSDFRLRECLPLVNFSGSVEF